MPMTSKAGLVMIALMALAPLSASGSSAEDLTEQQIIDSLVARKPAKKQREPTEAEIAASLKNMRIVQKKQEDGTAPSKPERDNLFKLAEINGGGRVGLDIEFAYRSAAVEDAATGVLRSLGGALSSSKLRKSEFLIAGHADRKGDPQFNLHLSQARAEAVKDYLISHYGLKPEQLIAVGYGFEHPKIADDPFDERNRRVEIINLATK